MARADELVVEEIGEEVLIYDKTTNRAHCLSPTAAKVWRACDGYTNTDELPTRLALDRETLGQALDELDSNALLENAPQIGHTRREMSIKAAKWGTAVSVPLIYSVVGPVPMAAATPTPAQCLHYTGGTCGSIASGGCASICGCCCCCTGCGTSNGGNGCSICYPASLCPPPGAQCPSNPGGVTGGANGNCTTSTCSTPGSGCHQPCTVAPVPSGNTACDSAFGNPCGPGL